LAIETIRRFRRHGFYQRGEIVSVELPIAESTAPDVIGPDATGPEGSEREGRIVRLYVSSPAYAQAERLRIDAVLTRMNEALGGAVRIEAIGQDMAAASATSRPHFGAADCDAVIAIMRPRLVTDPPEAAGTGTSEARGGVAGVLSAVQGRKADAGLPDIYIFRYAEPEAGDRAESDADWESRKQVFDTWFKAKGGQHLAFEDFCLPAEFAVKLEGQLRPWMARQGLAVPTDEPATEQEEEQARIEPAPSDAAVDSDIVGAQIDGSAQDHVAPEDLAPEELTPASSDVTVADSLQAPSDGEATTGDATTELVGTGSAADHAPPDDLTTGALTPAPSDVTVADRLQAPSEGEATPGDATAEPAETGSAAAEVPGTLAEAQLPKDLTPEHSPEGEPGPAEADTAAESAIIDDRQPDAPVMGAEAAGRDTSPPEITAEPADDAMPEVTLQPEASATEMFERQEGGTVVEVAPEVDRDEAAAVPFLAGGEQPELAFALTEPAETEAPAEIGGAPSDGQALDTEILTDSAEESAESVDENKPPLGARARARAKKAAARKAGQIQDSESVSAPIVEATEPHLPEIDAAEEPEAGAASEAAPIAPAEEHREDEGGSAQPATDTVESTAHWAAAIEATDRVASFDDAVSRDSATPDEDNGATVQQQEAPPAVGDVPQEPAEPDEEDRALEAETKNAVAIALRLERSAQARAGKAALWRRRIAWSATLGLVAVLVGTLAVLGTKWRRVSVAHNQAERTLATAADRASTLASDLTQAIQKQGSVSDADKTVVDRARELSGLLAKAGKFDPVERRNAVDTLLSSADELLRRGNVADALQATAQAQQILRTLSAVEPDQPDWLTRLAVSDTKTGEIFVTQKKTDEALSAFREAMAIGHALVLKEPANTDRQKSLSTAQQNVGDMLVAKGKLDEALAVYRDAQGLRKTLALINTDNPESQRDLLEIDNAIGDLLTAQNHLDEALVSYRQALAIAEKMAPKNLGDLKWSRALTLGNNKIGDVLLAKERIDDALAAYREGLAIVKGLAAKEPNTLEWQSLTATCQERIGDALSAESHQESALAAYQDALTIVNALAAKDPANIDWQRGISETQLRIGWVFFNQDKIDAAVAAHRESLAVVKAMVAKYPTDARWQRDLMLDDGKIAQLLMAQGKHDEALPIYQEALSVAKAMGAKDPGNPEWLGTRGVIDSNVGRLLMEAGNRDDALVAYRDARTVSESLVLKDPGNVDWQTGLVIAYYNLAEAGEEKNTNLLRALDILKRLDAAGVLPVDKKQLIPKIEDELAGPARKSKRR
jgi:tetratricopeptide (TPR) repeat protein